MPLILLVFHSILPPGASFSLRLSISSHLPFLATRRHNPKAPPVSALPASRASNKIPICQLGGGRAPDAHLPPLPRQTSLPLFPLSFSMLAPTCISNAQSRHFAQLRAAAYEQSAFLSFSFYISAHAITRVTLFDFADSQGSVLTIIVEYMRTQYSRGYLLSFFLTIYKQYVIEFSLYV